MVRVDAGEPKSWWFWPRGDKDADGWIWTLAERDLDGESEPLEALAVGWYRDLIAVLDAERARRGWSLRAWAAQAEVSVAAASTAVSGSSWPRWPTLEALADAVDHVLVVENGHGEEVVAALVRKLDDEPEFSGRNVAPEVVLRPSTIYALRKPGRAPSSSTVLALAAWLDSRVDAVPRRP